MNCTLKINDPLLVYYLGSSTFNSLEELKDFFHNVLSQGLIPYKGNISKLDIDIDGGYIVDNIRINDLDTAIRFIFEGLLDTNDIQEQFNIIVNNIEILNKKYDSYPVDNLTKELDVEYVKALLDFLGGITLNKEFKESSVYQQFKQVRKDLIKLFDQIDLKPASTKTITNDVSEADTVTSTPYIYSISNIYRFPSQKESGDFVYLSEDPLGILRHKVSYFIALELINNPNKEYYIRLEPDEWTNIQSVTPDSGISLGVVGVIYEKVGNEYRRVYVSESSQDLNEEVVLTTDITKAKSFGINQSKNFTLTIPDFRNPSYLIRDNPVNSDVIQKLIEVRNSTVNGPSDYFKISGSIQNHPRAQVINKRREYISLQRFLGSSKDYTLEIATSKINFVHPGNLYVLFSNGAQAPLNRTPLNDEWKQRIIDLVNYANQSPDSKTRQKIVDALNKILEFKGGDLIFYNRPYGIDIRRESLREGKSIIRLDHQESISVEIFKDVLKYARINVSKELLEKQTGMFPFVEDGKLTEKSVDWIDFYKEHHTTSFRQISLGNNKYFFGGIYSLLFRVETQEDIQRTEVAKQRDLPKIGSIEIEPDVEIKTLDLISQFSDLANKSPFVTREVLLLLQALSGNPEVQRRLENSTIKFITTQGEDFIGVSDDLEIFINYSLLTNFDLLGDVLAHELIHTLTARWIEENRNSDLVKRLESLIEKVPENIEGLNYTKDNPRFIYEILAAVSNPEAAKRLKKIKIKDKSLIEEIIDLFKEILLELFGISDLPKTVYDEIINKIVKISTSVSEPKPISKNRFGLTKKVSNNIPFGYSQEDVDLYLKENALKPSYLESLVQTIDADLAEHIVQTGKFADFIGGKLDFVEVFSEIYDKYVAEVDKKELSGNWNPTKEESVFYSSLANFDFILDYWSENTNFARIRKPKRGEIIINPVLEEIEEVDKNQPNDPTEVLDGENAEKEQVLSEISGGEEINEGRDFFERTGTEVSSINGADNMSRVFVRTLPLIERDEYGNVRFYNEISSEGKFVHTPKGYVKYKTNLLGRYQLVPYTYTWNAIAKLFADKLSLEEMLDSLDSNEYAVEVIPEVYILKERIKQLNIENTFEAELISKLETSFKRASVGVYIMLKSSDGRFSIFNESNDFVNAARKKVNLQFINLTQTEPYKKYYDLESGQFMIRQFLIDRGILRKENNEYFLITSKIDLFDLSVLGFVLNKETLKNKKIISEFKYNLLKFIANFDLIPLTIADFVIQDQTIETGKIKGLNNYFKSVYSIENSIKPLVLSTMVKNAENENQSILSVFNHILQVRNHINGTEDLSDLKRKVLRLNNPLFEYSLSRQILFNESGIRNKNRVLHVDILSGLKKTSEDSASEGKLTINLDEYDWILLNFISLIKEGIIENTRAETASTSYTTRLNNWNIESDILLKTPFSEMEVFSIWNASEEQIVITEDSRIFQVWSNYLRGELKRIKTEGGTFGIYSDIFTKDEKDILLNNINWDIDEIIDSNKSLIINSLNRFFQKEYNIFSKKFNKHFQNGSVFFEDPVLNNKFKNGELLNQYKLFFVLNSMVLHIEELILFQGDVSKFSKYFKRAKGVQSTGTPLSTSDNFVKFINKELQKNSFGKILGKPLTVSDLYKSSTIKDDIKPSAYYSSGELQEGYIESKRIFSEGSQIVTTPKHLEEELTLLKGYNDVNIGDGSGFVNPDFYFSILFRVGNLNQNQIIGYQALVLDARKNASFYFPEEVAKTINSQLTEEEEKLRKEGLELIAKGKVSFPILKVTQRGNALSDTEETSMEIMDKFALFPLFPQFIYNKPVAYNLFLEMIREGYAYVKFESGTKIHTPPPVDFIREIESGNTNVTLSGASHTLFSENLREQIKTANKPKKENTFGSQFRKLMLSHLWVDGKPVKVHGESFAGEFSLEWERVNQAFSDINEREILEKFGVKKVETGYDYSEVNMVKIADLLLREAKRQDLPKNIRHFFDKYKKGRLSEEDKENYYKHFEYSFHFQKIQSLVTSILKKISIQKLKGAQLIQTSSSIFDRTITVEGKTRELGFYSIKNGKVQAAECKVTIEGNFRNLLNLPDVTAFIELEDLEDNSLNRTFLLNRLLQSDDWVERHKDLLTIIGYRIPTQELNSIDVLIIREFLPEFLSNTIVLPPEITVKSGTDFDFDKLSIIVPIINKKGILETKGKDGIQNQIIETSSKILLDVVNYHKLITPNSNKIIFDYLKGTEQTTGLLSKLGLSYENPRGTSIISFETNLNQFNAVKAKNLLGIAAVWNPFTVLIQRHQINLNNNYYRSISDTETIFIPVVPVLRKNKEFKSFDYLTDDNIPKLSIISQLINVTVDAPSDNSFGLTIFDNTDFSAFIYGISMLGYSYEVSMNFFHQPVIYRFKSLKSDFVRQGYSNRQSLLFAAATIFDIEMKKNKWGKYSTKNIEKKVYDKAIEYQQNIDIDKLQDSIISIDDVYSSNVPDNLNVFAHYFLLLDQASAIRDFQSAINHDTAPDSTIYDTIERDNNIKKVIDSNIVDVQSILEIRNNSIISGLYISPILRNLSSQLFSIVFTPELLSEFGRTSLTFKKPDVALRKLSNDYILSIVHTFGTYNGKLLYDIAKDLLSGSNNIWLIKESKRLKDFFNKEGINYRIFQILTTSISKQRSPVLFNPQIFLGLENSTEEKDLITQEWKELLEHPESKKFAELLAIVGIVQSGWSKSPLYFSDLIPEDFITPIIHNAVEQYNRLSKDTRDVYYLDRFITAFKIEQGRSLGKRTLRINGEKVYTKRESYRLMDYAFIDIKQFLEDTAEEEQQLLEAAPQVESKTDMNQLVNHSGGAFLEAKEIQLSYGSEDNYLEALKRVSEQRGKIKWEDVFRNYSRFPQRIKNSLTRNTTFRKNDKLFSGGSFETSGRRIESIQDLADLYLIHRSPQIEKLHYIFLKNNEIVATHAATAGLVNRTAKFNKGLFEKTYEESGADSVYLLHNHPSGNHLPSDADLLMTHQITKSSNVNFKGQLIINTDKFSFIPATKDIFKYLEYEEVDYKKKPDVLFKTRITLGTSTKQITNSLKQIGDILLKEPGINSVIYLDVYATIVGYDSFTDGDVSKIDFQDQMKKKGAYSYVIFSPSKESNDAVESSSNHVKGYSSFYLENGQIKASLRFDKEFTNQVDLEPNQIQFWEKVFFQPEDVLDTITQPKICTKM